VTSFLFIFWGVLQLGYSLHPWTDIYAKSNDVVPGKEEVPFGGLDDYILYLDP